ncbi:EAL domain-containing protein [Billgrantia tianxiuensis]|jgi:diguanylate cyclase (GGDEF)-like protein/PAS domain S-box-containing protein|uniref:EAL domain-containing protein n=1 Tax=Billgrantia tianxiuensis TaxID=2497861 RepID=A0A6I6STW6_9GAMM|nr:MULTISPECIES: EAL domain-containing protein [Halomonas]MCE8033646.1 EAL domain-containing protein [Halomonas sp. MCCC 1A11057]QHC51235.1 EAL domain-containing protein [Halomonas tianxiuensis]
MSFPLQDEQREHDAAPLLDVSYRRQLAHEQVRLLYERLWQPILASVLAACLLVGAMWTIMPSNYLLGWLGALIAVSSGRLWLAWYYHRQPARQRQRRRWLQRFAWGAVMAGLLWGVAGASMFTMEHHGQLAALAIVLTGIAAGGVTTLSSVMWMAPLFVLPTMLPLLVQLLLQGTSLSLLLAAMVMLFLGLVLTINRRLYRTITDNISLRLVVSSRERQLRVSEARYRAIFRHTPLGVMHFDREGRVVDCNEMCLDILGTSRKRLLGMNLLTQLSDERVTGAIRDALESGTGYFEGTYRTVVSGKQTPLRAFYSALRNESGEVVGGVAVIEDFTERKLAEETIHRQAYYDPLTDLPNRRLLIETLASTIRDRRDDGRVGLVMFLDLDRFKIINDTLGHAVGDELLRQVSKRLLLSIDQDAMAARLSGDEFVVMMPALSSDREAEIQRAEHRAERLLTTLRRAYDLGGQRISVTPSIGYTLFPLADEDVGDVLRHADTAMYQAKLKGRAQICGYEPSMQTQMSWRLEMEQALRRALAEDQLSIAFQPQLDERGRVVGGEALMRWQHPRHGWVSPEVFIAIAEESDLIVELETWMLDRCCELLSRLPAETLPRLSVNISVRHFTQPGFVEGLTWVTGTHGIEPSRLIVEFTESIMIDGLQDAAERMQALKRLGVQLALDDFGTGFSSLAYLKSLPLDELKIDRSFVSNLDTDGSDAAIAETILAMAQHLGIDVVAEGVENRAQHEFLLARGCRLFQGYYFHRPMPAEAFEALLAGREVEADQPRD